MDLCVMQTFTDFKEEPTKTYHNYTTNQQSKIVLPVKDQNGLGHVCSLIKKKVHGKWNNCKETERQATAEMTGYCNKKPEKNR